MSATAVTPVSESLFKLGLNQALPVSEQATTSRTVLIFSSSVRFAAL